MTRQQTLVVALASVVATIATAAVSLRVWRLGTRSCTPPRILVQDASGEYCGAPCERDDDCPAHFVCDHVQPSKPELACVREGVDEIPQPDVSCMRDTVPEPCRHRLRSNL